MEVIFLLAAALKDQSQVLANTAVCFLSGEQKSISLTFDHLLKDSTDEVRHIEDLIFTGLAHTQEE